MKRATMIMHKEDETKTREEKIRGLRPASAKYAQVESRIGHETAAMQSKRREKFRAGDERKDACTFGGQLVHAGLRAQPAWRKGL